MVSLDIPFEPLKKKVMLVAAPVQYGAANAVLFSIVPCSAALCSLSISGLIYHFDNGNNIVCTANL